MKKFDTINVIPFIDIMLVLLAIVLATASFISQGKIEVNVPQSQTITITKDGAFFYQDKMITLAALDETLGKMTTERKITIKIDAQTDFQQFVHITDLLTKYSLKKVTVITTQGIAANNEVSQDKQ